MSKAQKATEKLVAELHGQGFIRADLVAVSLIEWLTGQLQAAYERGRRDGHGENAEVRRDRDEAERRLHEIRMLKFWTNEDDKKFFFADDVWDITDPDRHAKENSDNAN